MRLGLALLLIGCSSQKIEVDGNPCDLAEQTAICAQCFDGNVTCRYEGVSETAGSCGTCQAEWALYQRLCDDGVESVTCTGRPGAL